MSHYLFHTSACALLAALMTSTGCARTVTKHHHYTTKDTLSAILYQSAYQNRPAQNYLIGNHQAYVLKLCLPMPKQYTKTSQPKELCQRREQWVYTNASTLPLYPQLEMTIWQTLAVNVGEEQHSDSAGTYTLFVAHRDIQHNLALQAESANAHDIQWVNHTYHTSFKDGELAKITLDAQVAHPTPRLFAPDLKALQAQGALTKPLPINIHVYSQWQESSLFWFAQ
ncbi:MAG: hypothetical protein Q4C68_01915 [Moraxella sp.]|nr:hypothetical protein [Moraxella sp.]